MRPQSHSKATLMRPQYDLKARYKPSDVGERNVLLLATPLPPQLYRPNRLLEPGRFMGGAMGESPDTRRIRAGHAPWITLILPGAPPASTGPRNIGQAYGKWAESVLKRLTRRAMAPKSPDPCVSAPLRLGVGPLEFLRVTAPSLCGTRCGRSGWPRNQASPRRGIEGFLRRWHPDNKKPRPCRV